MNEANQAVQAVMLYRYNITSMYMLYSSRMESNKMGEPQLWGCFYALDLTYQSFIKVLMLLNVHPSFISSHPHPRCTQARWDIQHNNFIKFCFYHEVCSHFSFPRGVPKGGSPTQPDDLRSTQRRHGSTLLSWLGTSFWTLPFATSFFWLLPSTHGHNGWSISTCKLKESLTFFSSEF